MGLKIRIGSGSAKGDIKNDSNGGSPSGGWEAKKEQAKANFNYVSVKNPEMFKNFWEGEHEAISTGEESDAYLDAAVSNDMSANYWLGKSDALFSACENYAGDEEDARRGGGAAEAGDGDGEDGSPAGGNGDNDSKDNHGEGEGEAPPKDGSGESGDDEADGDEKEEGEDEGDGDGENDGEPPTLEERVKKLEDWRKKKVDPVLLGKPVPQPAPQKERPARPETPKPAAPAAGEPLPLPKEDDYGWLPDGELERLLYEKMYGKSPEAKAAEEAKKAGAKDTKPEWFDKALALMKQGKYLLLQGPSGCGKTHTSEQLAVEGMDLPFGMESCSESSHDGNLKGFLVPVEAGGNFIHLPSLFLSMCQHPGVFLWDELDAADGNWLVGFNSMLAQRKLYVPSRRLSTLPEFELEDIFEFWTNKFGGDACMERIKKERIKTLRDLRAMMGKDAYKALDDSLGCVKLHPKFLIIGAANTFGHGADMVYAGRNQLDGATLDRFRIGTFRLDYSIKVEMAICDPEVLVWGKVMREAIANFKMARRLVTTRFLKDASDMKRNAGWKRKDWEETYFADWDDQSKNKVLEYYKTAIVKMLKGGA